MRPGGLATICSSGCATTRISASRPREPSRGCNAPGGSPRFPRRRLEPNIRQTLSLRETRGNDLPRKSHDDDKTLGNQPPDAPVRQDSDRLFEELGTLKRLETEKQRTTPTTPEFHAMAVRVERQAKKVLDAAKAETDDGREAAREHEAEDNPDSGTQRQPN